MGEVLGRDSRGDAEPAVDRLGSLSRLAHGDRERAVAIGSTDLDVTEDEACLAGGADVLALGLETGAPVPRLDLDLAAVAAQPARSGD